MNISHHKTCTNNHRIVQVMEGVWQCTACGAYSSVPEARPVMQLSPDQEEALRKIERWSTSRFCFGGYAGTGKTSLIPLIRRKLGGRSAVVTYTNRASRVLQSKGIEDATTIHRLMYKLVDEERMIWQKARRIDLDFIIVDEASMVSTQVRDDLESYGVPVLYVGDPFQLPPVEGDEWFQPDYCLSKIHRNAGPIAEMAQKIRLGQPWQRDTLDQYELTTDYLRQFELVLCHSNARRRLLNERLRPRTGPLQPGDRVMAMKTFYDYDVINGDIGEVTRVQNQWVAEIDWGMGPVLMPNLWLLGPDDNPYKLKGKLTIDFGYASTVHKAQGSQYNSVLTWVERSSTPRLLYTAVTRGIKRSEVAT